MRNALTIIASNLATDLIKIGIKRMLINLEKGKDYHEQGSSIIRYNPNARKRGNAHKGTFPKDKYDPSNPYYRANNQPRAPIIPERPYVRKWVWVALGIFLAVAYNWQDKGREEARRLQKDQIAATIRAENAEMQSKILMCAVKLNLKSFAPWDIPYERCEQVGIYFR